MLKGKHYKIPYSFRNTKPGPIEKAGHAFPLSNHSPSKITLSVLEYCKSKCPSANEWVQKLWYIYTMEFYAAERKKELIPFAAAWMKLQSIMLSEISQALRDRYHTISPSSGT